MCLIVEPNLHPSDVSEQQNSITATFPILVYKVLDIAPQGKQLYGKSPYRGSRWTFGKQRNCRMVTSATSFMWCTAIGEGYHAFTAKNTIHARNLLDDSRNEMFPAIIPVGAEFWLGKNDEIASNQMVVYKSIDDVLKAFNVPAIANPVKKTSIISGTIR